MLVHVFEMSDHSKKDQNPLLRSSDNDCRRHMFCNSESTKDGKPGEMIHGTESTREKSTNSSSLLPEDGQVPETGVGGVDAARKMNSDAHRIYENNADLSGRSASEGSCENFAKKGCHVQCRLFWVGVCLQI